MCLRRWIDPEFDDEEDMSREVEAGPAQRRSWPSRQRRTEQGGKNIIVEISYVEIEQFQPLKVTK